MQYRRMSDRYQLPAHLIEEFLETGVCVIPAVLSEEEVAAALDSLHHSDNMLARSGFNSEDMVRTAESLSSLSATSGAGGILEVYYEDWKLRLAEHPRIVGSIQTLWHHTYCAYSRVCDIASCPETAVAGAAAAGAASAAAEGAMHFSHSFGPFNCEQGYMYIDRICYRLPQNVIDSVSVSAAATVEQAETNDSAGAAAGMSRRKAKRRMLQRSLGPHLDCCPHRMYDASSMRKWRPIQAFVALSDSLNSDEGGFEACRGLHKRFEEWANERTARAAAVGGVGSEPPCVGQFTPVRPAEDRDIIDGFCAVPCRRGDLVCWDFRIPHANARFNRAAHPRIAVYIGLLPGVLLNAAYAQQQLQQFRDGVVPNDQWQEGQMDKQHCNFQFSALGRKLMNIDPW